MVSRPVRIVGGSVLTRHDRLVVDNGEAQLGLQEHLPPVQLPGTKHQITLRRRRNADWENEADVSTRAAYG